MNTNAFVKWSDRYQNWVVVDRFGQQMFSSGGPMVFTERDEAVRALHIRNGGSEQ